MPTEPFVPLTSDAPSGAAQTFRVLLAEKPELAQTFHPPAPPVENKPADTAGPIAPCEPRVSLVREGDRITAIHIQCSCGQVMDLACTC